MLYCAINGKPTTEINCLDRGLSYGDGVFTTAKIVEGNVALLNAHIERLQTSCIQLNISPPDFAKLTQQITEAVKSFSLAVLKVTITAGVGGRGYSRRGAIEPVCIVTIFDYPAHYLTWKKQGIVLGNAEFQLGINPALAGIKHLNRLEQVMIRQEVDLRDEDDLLVCDINEQVIESSCANIFWQTKKGWQTPKIESSGVAGLIRAHILGAIDVEEVTIKLVELNRKLIEINSMFICNSVMGIVPVKTYNHHVFSTDYIQPLYQQLNARDLSL